MSVIISLGTHVECVYNPLDLASLHTFPTSLLFGCQYPVSENPICKPGDRSEPCLHLQCPNINQPRKKAKNCGFVIHSLSYCMYLSYATTYLKNFQLRTSVGLRLFGYLYAYCFYDSDGVAPCRNTFGILSVDSRV